MDRRWDALVFSVRSQCLAEAAREWRGSQLCSRPLHAGNLLPAARDQLLSVRRDAPVLERHRHSVLCDIGQAHAYDDLVKGGEFDQEVAGAVRRYERQATLHFAEYPLSMLAQEHFATASLPAKVVDKVDV